MILDTPGLNALGTEPELAVSMIPNAHAVLFLLAIDTGVTKSDLEVWQRFVHGKVARAIAVLNKIDLMWDDLRPEAEIEADIRRQLDETAHTLDLPAAHVIALSAQKALVGKIRNDAALVERSRIGDLERLFADEIILVKQEILRAAGFREIGTMVEGSVETVNGALAATDAERAELSQLSGKNRDLARTMLARLEVDRKTYLDNMDAFRGNYAVVLKRGHQMLDTLSDDNLDRMLGESLTIIGGTWTTAGLLRNMRSLFEQFEKQSEAILEFSNHTSEFVRGVYNVFHAKHGFPRMQGPQLSLEKHFLRVAQLKTATEAFCSDPVNVMTPKIVVVRRFYEQLANEAKNVFVQLRTDFDAWLRGALVPLMMQLRDHQKLLERRVESIRKIGGDISSLQDRVKQLDAQRANHQAQAEDLAQITATVSGAVAPKATRTA